MPRRKATTSELPCVTTTSAGLPESARREYRPVGFKTPALYQYLRHPIMLGFPVAFWATPVLTVGHLAFTCDPSQYILFAIQWEERDLVCIQGDADKQYRQQVRMLILLKKHGGQS